ncbi:MAG: hypothetical protein IPJ51_19945 [Saprospiraceae bacterium]|nr:hypothetical protein [Saprospiraceae bacterium]
MYWYNVSTTDTFFDRRFPSYFSTDNALPGSLIPLYSGSGFDGGNRFQIFGNITFNYAFSDSTLLKANLIHWGITDHFDLIREELIDEFHETNWI